MLKLEIPEMEIWNQETEEFITVTAQTLLLEHSLLSVSKWEAKYCKPFLADALTNEETRDYFGCMLITQNVNQEIFKYLPSNLANKITSYINAPMTATTFSNNNRSGAKKDSSIITSELIYYWMILHNIPFECEKWHLNRLLTLIRVCNAKSGATQKMSKSEIFERNRSLNAARRAKLHTRG